MVKLIVLIAHLWMHPFHVSVTDVKYKEDQKALQLSMRIFLDDLELALQDYSGDDKLDITNESHWETVNSSLKKYLLEKVKLWDEKNRPYVLNYVGAEIEEDVMWCYLEIVKVRKLNKVKIMNSILLEVWNDQENLVHFRAFEKVKSERLFKDEETKVFEWE